MIAPEGKLVLVDFGAAKQTISATKNIGRSTRYFTEAYAAPEIIAREKVGPESDIFELGMILYEMLTGKLPPSALSRLMKKDTWEPSELGEPWQSLVKTALELAREERPGTVAEWWQGRKQVNSGKTIPDANKIVLPALREQGMGRRLGLGIITSTLPQSQELVIVCSTGGAALFNLADKGALVWEIDCPAVCAATRCDGAFLTLGGCASIYLWDLANLTLYQQLQGHTAEVKSVAFSADGKLVVSGSKDKTVRLWDTMTGKQVQLLPGHTAGVNMVNLWPPGAPTGLSVSGISLPENRYNYSKDIGIVSPPLLSVLIAS